MNKDRMKVKMRTLRSYPSIVGMMIFSLVLSILLIRGMLLDENFMSQKYLVPSKFVGEEVVYMGSGAIIFFLIALVAITMVAVIYNVGGKIIKDEW